ncbi:MAG: OB-fold nucleic acid binding domain-containing protein [Thermofilaceae archaeon]
MSLSEKDVEGIYVRLQPSEMANLTVDEEGAYPEFKLEAGTTILKLRRVRVAGKVEVVEDRGRLVEVTVSDGKGFAKVRAWNKEARKLLDLKPGDLIEVLGVLRVFRGEVYIVLKLFRKIDEKHLSEYLILLKRDRQVLTSQEKRASAKECEYRSEMFEGAQKQ